MSFILQGWRVSLYTGKLHSYLSHKRIPFEFKSMNAFDLHYTIPKRVGASVMPVLQTQDGQYLQDTHDIILAMEKQFPNDPILPSSVDSYDKRILSFLIAAWADEFWVPIAMHFRWNFPESVEFFKAEAKEQLLGRSSLSEFFPNFLIDATIEKVVGTLNSYLPSVGVREGQTVLIEKWADHALDMLEKHFSKYDYILGTETPTIGDFGLAGPLIAHLCRDPYPLHNLMIRYPYVTEYAARMTPKSWLYDSAPNELPVVPTPKRHSNDRIPSTLVPIISSIFGEFVPMIKATQKEIEKLRDHPKFSVYGERRGLPRALGDISFPMLNGTESFTKAALPFNVWKFQQVTKELQALSLSNQSSFVHWLTSHKIPNTDILSDQEFPILKRDALRVKF